MLVNIIVILFVFSSILFSVMKVRKNKKRKEAERKKREVEKRKELSPEVLYNMQHVVVNSNVFLK